MSHPAPLRWTGLAGITAAALLVAADWLMLGVFTSGRELRANWLQILAGMPRWRLVAGGLAGPVGTCLYALGFWQLYLALRPGGRYLAFLVFAGFATSFVWIAGGFHTSFPFLADLWRMQQAAPPQAAAPVEIEAIAADSFAYARILYAAALPPAFIACLLLAYAVLFRPTAYPRWFAVSNPLFLYLAATPVEWLPAPLGGPLTIAAGNLVFLLFFTVSTVLLWHGGKRTSALQETPEPL